MDAFSRLSRQTFTVEASADLESWFGIGADTNGLMQFDDTNTLPARFYNTIPQ